MKKIVNSVVTLTACLLCLMSCKEDEEVITTLSIDKTEITMGADGGIEPVTVSGDVNWQTSTDASWIKMTPAAGYGPGICEVKIDSSVIAGFREAEIRFYSSNNAFKSIKVVQAGYEKGVYVEGADEEFLVENSADTDKRFLDITMTANVNFSVRVESDGWLTYKDKVPEYDYGARPRTFKQRFAWTTNTSETERTAQIIITPDEGEVVTLNVRQKSAPKITDDRAGDSLAILAIYDSMKGMLGWDASENMMYWDGVELWEATDAEVKEDPDLVGRVKSVTFRLFDTKESLPYQVQYLKTARSIYFSGNTNTFLKSIRLGDDICKLAQYGNLKELTISAYGLVELPENFKELGKTLEVLDLSSNNFQKIPDEINPTNFPKLRTLLMGANTRRNIYDLSNTVETNYGGLVDEEGFPRRMIEWDLDTLQLSVNYLQGPLPKMDDWEKYTEQDIIDADTLPRALIGTPKVMPHTKRFAINLNRLTGELPDWLLYHPALDWWSPFQLVFTQEGKDATGASAGFGNEPANLNYYYKFYEGYKKDPGAEDEDEDTTK